jgi:hypothetical protein
MRDYFKDNQQIRHRFGIDKIIVGLFNYEKTASFSIIKILLV